MNLNGILIGSEDPQRLTAYYTQLFGEPRANPAVDSIRSRCRS
jgi:hypothetical protein